MNKTTLTALKLAEEALEYARSSSQNQEMWGYFNKALQGLYAIREALADHIPDATKMVGCAYCDNPLFAGTKCNNCGRVTLAEPVKQEPVTWGYANESGEVIRCVPPCGQLDKYKSMGFTTPLYAAPVDAKAIRAEALEEAAKLSENKDYRYRPTALTAAIRGLK